MVASTASWMFTRKLLGHIKLLIEREAIANEYQLSKAKQRGCRRIFGGTFVVKKCLKAERRSAFGMAVYNDLISMVKRSQLKRHFDAFKNQKEEKTTLLLFLVNIHDVLLATTLHNYL